MYLCKCVSVYQHNTIIIYLSIYDESKCLICSACHGRPLKRHLKLKLLLPASLCDLWTNIFFLKCKERTNECLWLFWLARSLAVQKEAHACRKSTHTGTETERGEMNVMCSIRQWCSGFRCGENLHWNRFIRATVLWSGWMPFVSEGRTSPLL